MVENEKTNKTNQETTSSTSTKPTYVILAAGRGRRLWPVGESMPKCMIRVLGKPILEWTLEGVLAHASRVVVVVGYKKELVVEYFSKKPYANRLVFVEQTEQKGTAHALLQAKKEVSGPFVTVNGDSFAEPAFFEFLGEFHGKKPDAFFAIAKQVEDARSYGLFNMHEGKLAGLIEKPKEKVAGLVGLGNYYLPESFFDYLEKVQLSPRGEYELTDALSAFVKDHSVFVHAFSGFRGEMTYFWDHLELNIYALEHFMQDSREGLVEQGAIVEGKLYVGKGSVIKAGTRVEGPAYIGQNCLIGPNAFIRRGSVIEDGCHVGTSEIKNSVVMNRANVPHFSYVGDSVLCEDVNLGAGSMIANLRFDNEPIPVHFREGVVDSGRRKLGAAIGSGTKIGVNCSINCGVLIGHDCKVFPGVSVRHNLDNNAVFKGD